VCGVSRMFCLIVLTASVGLNILSEMVENVQQGVNGALHERGGERH